MFECEQEKNGFFAKHLLKAISDEHRNKSVEEVLLHVSRGKSCIELLNSKNRAISNGLSKNQNRSKHNYL